MGIRQQLIDHQVASPEQVDEALARQSLYGGDIATNLLELTTVAETTAQNALAQFYGMAAAPPGELPYASAAAVGLVPRTVATSWEAYPLRLESGVLTVVTAQPLSDRAKVDLGFALKVELRGLIALEPRVKQAIARDYAFALDKRTQKAIARLEKRPEKPLSQAPTALSAGPSLSDLPRPQSVAPAPFPAAWAESLTPTSDELLAETAEQPAVVPREPRQAPTTAGAVPVAPSQPARRRGPYTAAQAKRDLRDTTTPQQVLAVYFNYAAQYFDQTAAFTLNRHEARLQLSQGLASATLGARVQVGMSAALTRVSESRQWVTTKLVEDDPTLAGVLGLRGATQGILLQVRVKERCAVVVYGGLVNSDVELADVGELLAFEALAAHALEHSIRIRKTVLPSPGVSLPSAPLAPKYSRPSVESRAQAVANLLGNDAQKPAPEARPNRFSPRAGNAADYNDPVIRQAERPIPAQPTSDDIGGGMGLPPPGGPPPGPSSRAGKSEDLAPLAPSGVSPLTSQPPGVYEDELDEARDSGWDFDL